MEQNFEQKSKKIDFLELFEKTYGVKPVLVPKDNTLDYSVDFHKLKKDFSGSVAFIKEDSSIAKALGNEVLKINDIFPGVIDFLGNEKNQDNKNYNLYENIGNKNVGDVDCTFQNESNLVENNYDSKQEENFKFEEEKFELENRSQILEIDTKPISSVQYNNFSNGLESIAKNYDNYRVGLENRLIYQPLNNSYYTPKRKVQYNSGINNIGFNPYKCRQFKY